MLSAGVAFRQQFWPVSVSVKRLSRASTPSDLGIPLRIESAGFESGARRAIRRGMAAGFDPRFGDLAIDKAAAAGAAALNKKPDAICRRLHWRTSCRRTRTA